MAQTLWILLLQSIARRLARVQTTQSFLQYLFLPRDRDWETDDPKVSQSRSAAGLFTAPAAGGTGIVANAALSGLSASTVVSERTVATTAAQTAQNLYVNVATAQGAAATFDVYVYGYDLTQQS